MHWGRIVYLFTSFTAVNRLLLLIYKLYIGCQFNDYKKKLCYLPIDGVVVKSPNVSSGPLRFAGKKLTASGMYLTTATPKDAGREAKRNGTFSDEDMLVFSPPQSLQNTEQIHRGGRVA